MTGFLITDPFEQAKTLLELEARITAIEDTINLVRRVEAKWGERPQLTIQTVESAWPPPRTG